MWNKLGNNFINREDSWLDFNQRVLAQTFRADVPVQKHFEFIGIASSNLDEFISVRFSGCTDPNVKGYILKRIKEQKNSIQSIFKSYQIDLDVDENISKLDKVFERIYPTLCPIAVNNKEIPKLTDDDVNFFLLLKDEETKESSYCFLQIPHQLERIIEAKGRFYTIENLIRSKFDKIFNRKVVNYIQFSVNKSYCTEVIHDTTVDIVNRVNDVLKSREENNITFVDILRFSNDDSKLIKKLIKLLGVPKSHVFISNWDKYTAIGLHCLKSNKITKDSETLENEVWNNNFKPSIPEELFGYDSVVDYIDDEDLVLHHPYDDYKIFLRFLDELARDPNTLTIKQTLYRVSNDKSPIIKSLCYAASRGVKVTVMLELLARFDEKQNVSLINKLKSAGCTIVYSLENLKTHAKMCVITKKTDDGIKIYSHIGTGNYNERTAKIYTDISYITSRRNIGFELSAVFNMITGFSKPENLNYISYSPITLRSKLEEEILNARDYALANPDVECKVKIKVNSISDNNMVALINRVTDEADNLHFFIIVRGICSLPSKNNIHIKSVVGRFLEHSRIYIFENKKKRLYISSADMLTRNLDKRVELLAHISDKDSMNKISGIFNELWKDTANSFILNNDGNWTTDDITDETYINSQNKFTL